jgi:hypothetical protein
MCPRDIVRAAQQLALAIQRADHDGIDNWQAILRSLEPPGPRTGR